MKSVFGVVLAALSIFGLAHQSTVVNPPQVAVKLSSALWHASGTTASAAVFNSAVTAPAPAAPPAAMHAATIEAALPSANAAPVVTASGVSPAPVDNLAGYVTQQALSQQLSDLSDSMRQLIYNANAQSTSSLYASLWGAIALSQRIDTLPSTVTVGGSTVVTQASLPALSGLSGLLGISQGGTGITAVPTYGQILVGDGNGNYTLVATSSLGLASGGSNPWAISGSNISFGSGNVGIGTTSASALLAIDSTSATGTIIRISNGSTGGHVYDFLETGSANTGGAGRLDFFDRTTNTARLSIATNGNVGIATTSPFANFSVNGSGYFSGNLNVGDASTTRANLGLAYASASSAVYSAYSITAWGDSLTAGNEDGTGVTYPASLSSDLGGRPVNNEGVGGQTSTQIGVRQGGVSTSATVSGGQIPASGGVTVTFTTGYEPVTSQGPSSVSGTISGIAGSVSLSGSTYTFTRSTAGATTTVSGTVPFVVSTGTLNNGTVIIWAGRNNYSNPSQVESDIASMVSSLGSNTHYLVLSIMNGEYSNEFAGQSGYAQITGINNYLSTTYPGHYFDIREWLVQNGLSQAGIATSTQDQTDYNNDVPPTDLRYDNVHLNATGYQLVATQVANFITAKLDTSGSSGVLTSSVLPSVFASPYAIGSVAPGTGAFSSLAIGTTTTSSGLTITGGGINFEQSGGIFYLKQSNGNGAAGFQVSGNGNYVQTLGTGLVPNNDNTQVVGVSPTSQRFYAAFLGTGASTIAGSLSIGTTTTAAPGNGLLVWGNVAIGTTTSAQKLYVSGGNIQFDNGYSILTKDGSGNPLAIAQASGSNLFLGGSYVNNVYLGTGSNGESQALTIQNGGNIGVGTTSPSSRLEVVGNLQITNSNGGIYFRKSDTSAGNSIVLAGDGSTLQTSGSFVPASDNSYSLGILSQRWAALRLGAGVSSIAGSLGVGTTTPTTILDVAGGGTAQLTLENDNGVGAVTGINFNTPLSGTMFTGSITSSYYNSPGMTFTSPRDQPSFGGFAFKSNGGTTRLLIDTSTGNVGLGTTSPFSRLEVWGPDTASSTPAFTVVNNASTTEFQVFDGGNAQLSGTLTQNSDQRLKTNVQSLDASSSLSAIDALNPVTFNWIDPTEGTTPQLGFIAQQVQQLFPALISTTSPTPLTPGGTLGLNYIGLISPIVSAIQGLSSEVTSLGATVAGFADSFTSKQVTTNQLCLTDNSGTTCYTRSQLNAAIENATSPNVNISDPTPPTISGTTTPPSINIQGANPAIIQVGDTYADLGAIATDNQGDTLGYKTFLNGTLVSNIVIDTSQAATDTIDYVATDTWGNTSTSTRTVIVHAAPSSTPM